MQSKTTLLSSLPTLNMPHGISAVYCINIFTFMVFDSQKDVCQNIFGMSFKISFVITTATHAFEIEEELFRSQTLR